MRSLFRHRPNQGVSVSGRNPSGEEFPLRSGQEDGGFEKGLVGGSLPKARRAGQERMWSFARARTSLMPNRSPRNGTTGPNRINAARFELGLIVHSLPNDEVCDEGHEKTSTSIKNVQTPAMGFTP
jgi:hypothetical protein